MAAPAAADPGSREKRGGRRMNVAKAPVREKRVQSIRLENGLDLEIFDRSQKLAGDRHRVALIARIQIPVRSVDLEDSPEGADQESVIRLLGETVTFEKKMERHFIDQKEKAKVFHTLKESFLSSTYSYLSHPEFAKKCVLKTYRTAEAKRRWCTDPTAA
jgi:hypothetical protein